MTANTPRESTDLEWLLQKVDVVRAAWKLILVTFLTLGIVGGAVLYAITRPVYTSHMVLPLPPTVQALIYTDAILAPVVRKIDAADTDISGQVQRLRSRLSVSELKSGSDLFSIAVTDHSPQRAQAILDQILAQITVMSKPSGTRLAAAQQQIASEKRAVAELKEVLATLREQASRAKGGAEGESNARSFVFLVSDIAVKEQKIWELESRLEGFKLEDVVVRPTLESRPDLTALYRRLAALLLVSLLLPLSFVFLRDLWRKRSSSKDNPSNIQRAA